MPYGKLALDTIETSGSLAVTGNVTTTGTLQPSALRGLSANTPPVFRDSAGTEIGTLCRAWVNFNGTGTVAIRAAFNVSSITDSGTGTYDVNFTNSMPDANFSAVGSCGVTNNNTIVSTTAPTISRVTVTTVAATGGSIAFADIASINAAVFR